MDQAERSLIKRFIMDFFTSRMDRSFYGETSFKWQAGKITGLKETISHDIEQIGKEQVRE